MTDPAHFNEEQKSGLSLPPVVESYGLAGVKIGGRLWSEPILLLPSGVRVWRHSNPLKADDFDFLDEQAIGEQVIDENSLLIVGMGEKTVFLGQKLEKSLQKRSVPFEVMATSAACRCYNLLLAEGRRVVAALLPL